MERRWPGIQIVGILFGCGDSEMAPWGNCRRNRWIADLNLPSDLPFQMSNGFTLN